MKYWNSLTKNIFLLSVINNSVVCVFMKGFQGVAGDAGKAGLPGAPVRK